TAVAVSLCNEAHNPQRWDFRAMIIAWIVLGTAFLALFPALGRCTILVCIAGFGSGLTLPAVSSYRGFLNVVVYTITVNLYWIGLASFSSPYSPAFLFYEILTPGLSRSAHVSTHVMVGNLIVLNLFIWFGSIYGYSCVKHANGNILREQSN